VDSIVEAISQNPFVQEEIKVVTEAVQEQVKATIKQVEKAAAVINEVANNPVVEKTNEQVVAPAMIVASVAVVAPSLWSILFPLFRFLFLQPVLIFGKRKREGWGIVYNCLDKLPIDLAVVRLIDAKTHKVIQSRVTDKQGRYLFVVEPGEYQLEVVKSGYVFPSKLMAEVRADGRLADIYHGEHVAVTQEEINITPNVPLDPIGEAKTIKRIVREKRLRVFQHIVSFSGIMLTAVSLYISPTWYIGAFLAVHIGLYTLFIRQLKPKTPKGWGIVYDKDEKKPIGKTVARLFSKEFNRLVSSQLTDKNGRYAFLVGPSDYYVLYEKEGYKQMKSRDIDMKEVKEPLIKEDVELEKTQETNPKIQIKLIK
jgi:hypothetical protein